jgi:fibronectin-binding autotransporter adhesin
MLCAPPMLHFPPRLALVAALILGHGVLRAQSTVIYTSGENKTGAIVLNAAGDPTTLAVATGTATQSGNITESGGSFGFTKDGAGTLVLTGSNSFSGITSVMAGTLQTGTTGALGTGVVNIESAGQLNLIGGTHSLIGLSFNTLEASTGSLPFLVVSGGATLDLANAIGATYGGPVEDGVVVTGTGSRVTTLQLGGDRATFTVANGGTLQLTNVSAGQLGSFNIGAKAGETAVAPGYLAIPSNANPGSIGGTAQFNHTATDYWFTSDGTAAGSSIPFFGDYRISAGTTIFKNTADTGGSLVVNGGEARFSAAVQSNFQSVTINAGGTATFAANFMRPFGYGVYLNGGTLRATESFTVVFNPTDRIFQTTGGTFSVDAGKTLTLATEHDPITNAYVTKGQAVNGTGSFVKTGAGTLVVERDYVDVDLGVPDFTVRQGTLRTPSYVFDEVVVGKLAGDNGSFTLAPTNLQQWSAGVPLSLGFMYANYWTPIVSAPPILAEFDLAGMPANLGYLVPAVQSRSLTLGEQAGATGNLILNEGAAGGWFVDNGLAVIGGAGTGNVTLGPNHFLYNNGRHIVLGQSAGGVGNVMVSGANAQLNAGLDLTPLDPFNYSGQGDTPAVDRGVGNILIGLGGTGHVTVTNNARILAGQTFIGAGSDLTLGSGGTIYGGFTAQSGSTVHALDDATFAFTLGSVTEASSFEAGSTFLVDASADLIFAITQGSGFGLGTYTLFDFAPGSTLTGLNGANFSATGLGGYGYAFDLTATHLNLIVTTSAIPEPSTYAMLAGVAALGFVIMRRRRIIRL